jgi:hypothetical protein
MDFLKFSILTVLSLILAVDPVERWIGLGGLSSSATGHTSTS